MKIAVGYPPNYKQIKKALNPNEDTIFTYGETIYIQSERHVSVDLLVHEQTHIKQQGKDPKAWWNNYIADSKFRLNQEVEAYQNQYSVFCSHYKDRNVRARFLYKIAGDLSGSLYGNIVDFRKATELIKNG